MPINWIYNKEEGSNKKIKQAKTKGTHIQEREARKFMKMIMKK